VDAATHRQLKELPDFARWRAISRTADSRPCSTSIATPRRGWVSCRSSSTTRSTTLRAAQVSTIYTQLNQYHVVLEVLPAYQENPDALKSIYVKSASGAQVPPVLLHPLRAGHDTPRHQSPGTVSVSDAVLQLAPGSPSATPSPPSRTPSGRSSCPSPSGPASRARPRPSRPPWPPSPSSFWPPSSPSTSSSRALRELHPFPSPFSPRLPSAGGAPFSPCSSSAPSRHHPPSSASILLIGIVKKNAIMMIDFALEAERESGQASRGGDLPGCPPALPANHDDNHGALLGACPSLSARAPARSCGGRSASPSWAG